MSVERQQGKILIVEDDGFIRSSLKQSLLRQGVTPADIHDANDFASAFKRISQEQYSVILLDVNLDPEDPENKDGIILFQDIRRSNNNADSYIFDISSSMPDSDEGIPNIGTPEIEELRVKTWEVGFDDAAARIIQIRKSLTPIRNHNG